MLEPDDAKETAPSGYDEFRHSAASVPNNPNLGHNFGRISVFPPTRAPIQPKLKISEPGDMYEQEADRVAEHVMRMPEPVIQRKAPCPAGAPSCKEEEENVVQTKPLAIAPLVQRQAEGATETEEEEKKKEEEETTVQTKEAVGQTPGFSHNLETQLSALRSGGQPLPDSARAFFEPRFGHDFSKVRVHHDTHAAESARAVNAQAYTVGNHIVFGAGQYTPGTEAGKRLLAHELTHILQQEGTRQMRAHLPALLLPSRKLQAANVSTATEIPLIQRKPQGKLIVMEPIRVVAYGITFERSGNGLKMEVLWWVLSTQAGMPMRSLKEGELPPTFKNPSLRPEKLIKRLEAWTGLCMKADARSKLLSGPEIRLTQSDEYSYTCIIDKRQLESWFGTDTWRNYLKGNKTSDKTCREEENASEEGQSEQGQAQDDELLRQKAILEQLPPEVKQLMGTKGTFEPKDYQQLLRIAEKLKNFGPEDFAVYKLLTIKATDNLDLFEKSVDMYLARKEELKKALKEELRKTAGAKEPTLQDAIAEKWKGFDESAIGTMSEDERYKLARQKTSEVTGAQLKYMKEHPGETLKDFAKAATLMNTGETFSAIGKDITEVAKGDANAWARWAAGTGAGAKLSGWLLAVAGILYVASWLTGIGELATIAAAAGILLGATLTLSLAESELRIKAASQARTPEEFKRNVELAAAARTNVYVGIALIVVAAVLHFTAKALFPKTMQNIRTALKNFRERVRLKGSVYKLKPQIVKEMGLQKAELVKSAEMAKQSALAAAKELEGLSTEQFVEKLEKGDGGFLDQSKLPPEQKVNFSELLKTPEGRTAIDGYKQKLVNALKTEVVAEIDRLTKENTSKIDEFLKDVDAAKNHDALRAAADKLEGVVSEEHAKAFMKKEQETIVRKNIEEGIKELEKEVAATKAPKTGGVHKVTGTLEGPKVQTYGMMKGKLPAGVQANHLNQDAAFRSVIPQDEGAAVAMRGNAFTEPGTPHYNFHNSLESFWQQYRPGGSQFGKRPTNAEYSQALNKALQDSGFSANEAAALETSARNNRAAHGLLESDPVPRIPGKLPQKKPP